MVLNVEDLDAWWGHLVGLNLTSRFEGVKLREPEIYPWGKREIHMIDPSGVLRAYRCSVIVLYYLSEL